MGQDGGEDGKPKRQARAAGGTRRQRLAAALRANLAKRKAQARAHALAPSRPSRPRDEPGE
jgi:hypothetical protein